MRSGSIDWMGLAHCHTYLLRIGSINYVDDDMDIRGASSANTITKRGFARQHLKMGIFALS